jgi:tetratricopeptide (TPR) repeat protein
MAKLQCKNCYKEFKKGLFEKDFAKDRGFCSFECMNEWNEKVQKAKRQEREAADKEKRKLQDLKSDFTVFKGQAEQAYYKGNYDLAKRMYEQAHEKGPELVKVDRSYERQAYDVEALVKIFNAGEDERLAKIKKRAEYISIRLDANLDEAIADYKYGLTFAPGDAELLAGLKEVERKKAEAAESVALVSSITDSLLEESEGPESRCCWCGNVIGINEEFCDDACRQQFRAGVKKWHAKYSALSNKSEAERSYYGLKCACCQEPMTLGMIFDGWEALYCSEKCYRTAQRERRQSWLQEFL